MADEKDYSFILNPGIKTRYIAGPFNVETREPHYGIEIDVPSHVRGQIEVKQFLLGTPEKCQWAWDIKNNSEYLAFVTVLKDGKNIKDLSP